MQIQTYISIGKHELRASPNLLAVRRNLTQAKSMARCCAIDIHAMNTTSNCSNTTKKCSVFNFTDFVVGQISKVGKQSRVKHLIKTCSFGYFHLVLEDWHHSWFDTTWEDLETGNWIISKHPSWMRLGWTTRRAEWGQRASDSRTASSSSAGLTTVPHSALTSLKVKQNDVTYILYRSWVGDQYYSDQIHR